jgi:hypothetical protein
MSTFARFVVRRRRYVVGAWLVALVAIVVASSSLGGEHRVDYSIPGSDPLGAVHPRAALRAGRQPVLFVFDGGSPAAIDAVLAKAAAVGHVSGVGTVATSNGISIAPGPARRHGREGAARDGRRA